jgi:RNA 2',3'-cyclic 3'-phosphodiesterase
VSGPGVSGPVRRRLFVALPVDPGVAEDLSAALAGRRAGTDWRWTAPETWHVTLAFLGEVWEDPADVLSLISEGVAGGGPAPTLSLAGPLALGPRVVAYAVDDAPAGAVAALGEAVQDVLDTAGVPVQRRRGRASRRAARPGPAPTSRPPGGPPRGRTRRRRDRVLGPP